MPTANQNPDISSQYWQQGRGRHSDTLGSNTDSPKAGQIAVVQMPSMFKPVAHARQTGAE